jgi:hypothetical protein
LTGTLSKIFPDQIGRLRALRETDAGFDEICGHFEIMLKEAANRFGEIDSSTADLIASFDDLRREIELRLRAPNQQEKTSP